MNKTLVTLAAAAMLALGAAGTASAGATTLSVAKSVVAAAKADATPDSIRRARGARFSRRYCIHLRYLAFQKGNRTARRLYYRHCN